MLQNGVKPKFIAAQTGISADAVRRVQWTFNATGRVAKDHW